jgi:hypothetical protein
MVGCGSGLQLLALRIAALLLALHWAAPSFRPFHLPAQAGDAPPAYAPAQIGIHHGSLPRALARIQAFEILQPKAQRDALFAGKLALLDQADRPDRCGSPDVGIAVAHERRTARPAHSFEARGPPLA